MNMLYEQFAHDCVLLTPTRQQGSEGGWKTVWTEGTAFACRMLTTNSMETTEAEKGTLEKDYGAFVDRDTEIRFGNYFKDTETGRTYRVTSEPDDERSPGSASFALKHFTARREVPPE